MLKIKRIPSEPNLQILLDTIDIKNIPLYFIHLKWMNASDDRINFSINENFIKLIEASKDLDGTGFICFDNDIFLVLRPDPHKKLKEMYQSLIKACGISGFDFEMNIYDTKIQHDKIFMLCNKKIDAYRETLKLKENEKKPQKKLSLNKEDIKTIAKRRAKNPAQILLVEDDIFSRHLVKNLLNSYFKVIEAENHIEALEAYLTHAPDVVFLDIDLPDSTGLDIIQQLKAMDPEAFVMMLSGNAYKENIKKSLELGAAGFIAKPFNKKSIADALENCPHLIEKGKNTFS